MILRITGLLACSWRAVAEALYYERKRGIGVNKPARIATVCQGGEFYPTVDENRAHVMVRLELAMACEPDLVVLPETFTTVSITENLEALAEPVPGPTTDSCAKLARQHGTYVVCPIRTVRDKVVKNSAVIISRDGGILGIYEKSQPVTTSDDYTVFERGVRPGASPPPVFDLDFGRIGIQICFDAGFPEGWQSLADQGARLVLWPSAYNGGFPLRAYAYLHQFHVVTSVRTDGSRIIDPLGQVTAKTDQRMNVVWRDLSLDFVVSHWDFNYTVPDTILAKYGRRVRVTSDRDSGHFVVESLDPDLPISGVMEEFGLESSRQYHQRHREAYGTARDGDQPAAQTAAHALRPQYSR
jgi:predicted amidohydrolase